MPYGWTHEIQLLQHHMWVPYQTFMTLLNGFKFKSFTVKANRDQMKTALENLRTDIPFNANKRFDANAIYVDLNHSVPSRLFRQLTMALDISDRQSEKDRVQGEGVNKRELSNMEDAKVAFFSALDGLLDITGPMPIESAYIVGVFIQSTFESYFQATWTD